MSFLAKSVLDAVESWARPGARLLREVEIIGGRTTLDETHGVLAGNEVPYIPGRLDGLLVPTIPWECKWQPKRGWCWDGCSLAAIEVKVTRADFARGLSEGQFERYLSVLGALYLAVPKELATSVLRDLPAGVGLIAYHGQGVALCVRQAKPRRVPAAPEMLWKVLHLLDESARARESALRHRAYGAARKIGERGGYAIRSALEALAKDPAE